MRALIWDGEGLGALKSARITLKSIQIVNIYMSKIISICSPDFKKDPIPEGNQLKRSECPSMAKVLFVLLS